MQLGIKNQASLFLLHSPFAIFGEYRSRFGKVNLKTSFSFASALTFRYICIITNT